MILSAEKKLITKNAIIFILVFDFGVLLIFRHLYSILFGGNLKKNK